MLKSMRSLCHQQWLNVNFEWHWMRTWVWAGPESYSCSFILCPEIQPHILPAHLCILDSASNILCLIPLISAVKVPGRDWLQGMTQICNWPQNAVKQSSLNTFQLIVSDFWKWSGYVFLLYCFPLLKMSKRKNFSPSSGFWHQLQSAQNGQPRMLRVGVGLWTWCLSVCWDGTDSRMRSGIWGPGTLRKCRWLSGGDSGHLPKAEACGSLSWEWTPRWLSQVCGSD